MYDNPIICPHIKPGPILWINCQVVTMHLNHEDDYAKDHDVNEENDTMHQYHDDNDDHDYAKDHD